MVVGDAVLELEKLLYKAVVKASTIVPAWLTRLLEEHHRCASGYARIVLETLLRAAKVSADKGLPLCQDTGTPLLVVRRAAIPFDKLWKAFRLAIRRATLDGFLRLNNLNPVDGSVESDNSSLPYIVVAELETGEEKDVLLDATILLRGGGAEYVSLATGGPSTELEERIAATVVEVATRAGAKPCPPYIISVGVGATLAQAVAVAYTGLAYRVPGDGFGWPSLEQSLTEKLEKLLDVGPAGIGGKPTVLQVWVNTLPVHPASAAIAVVFQCWPLRRVRILVKTDGEEIAVT